MVDCIMAKIRITQIKSVIGADKRQKATMKALGLKKIGQVVVHNATPAILGMVEKINHLTVTENV